MADVLSGAANEPNSELLAALQQLSAEDLAGLLRALKAGGAAGGSDFQQINLGNSKNFQVNVEGGTAYIADRINIDAGQISLDVAVLEQVVEQLFEKLAGSRQQSISVPYFYPSDLGSRTFVGRVEELGELHGLLQGGERVAIAAATGMGGIGKTELAWQYCRAWREDYAGGIWWLTVRGGSLASQVLGLAVRMGLGQPPESLEAEAAKVQWCFDRWGQVVDGDRLLVLDDVVEYGPLRELLPQDARFKVLLTTRRKLGPPVQRLDLGGLSEGEALELLRRLVADDGRLAAEPGEAKALCGWLGYLPLGIELVGRYLARKPGLAVATLLGRLEEKRLEALAVRKVPEEMPYQLNLAAAFELSWAELDEDGQRLGCLLSLFALAPIPWELVQACLPEWDEEELEDCRDEQLLGQSLLEFVEKGRYQLHQVIRENFAAKLEEREDTEALQTSFAETLASVAMRVPQIVTVIEKPLLQDFSPHLGEFANFWLLKLNEEKQQRIFASLTRFFESQCLWSQARKWHKQFSNFSLKQYGLNSLAFANAINNYAGMLDSIGDFLEAEKLYLRCIEISTHTSSDISNEATATYMQNLGTLYVSMLKLDEARELLEQALRIRETILGVKHFETARTLSNLANLLRIQENFEPALLAVNRALKIFDVQNREFAPDLAVCLNNRGLIYQAQGLYQESKEDLESALAFSKLIFGNQDLGLTSALSNLAVTYRHLGNFDKAEMLYLRSLSIRIKFLGFQHPDVAVVLANLGALLCSKGEFLQAEPLIADAAEIYRASFGKNHKNTKFSINQLSEVIRTCLEQGLKNHLSSRPVTQLIINFFENEERSTELF